MQIPRALSSVAAVILSLGLLASCDDADADTASASLLTQDSFASTIADAMVDSGSAHVIASGSVGGQDIKAEGDQQIGTTAADSRLSLNATVYGVTVDLRLIDQVIYANLGPLSQSKFATVDLTDNSNPLVAQFRGLASNTDVSQQFENIADAIDGLKKDGKPQTIDGVEAQPYVVTVDPSALPQSDEPASEPVEFTVFVGPDNLPRRIVSEVNGSPFTLDFSKWGESVDVAKPPADQISDQNLADLLAGLTALLGAS